MLYTPKDIEHKINQWGFLPFFKGEIEGFSIEEQITPDCWFDDEEGGYGVWDWKNDIIIDGDCAYGKFYLNKACFVSMDWFPDLLSWRRSQHTLSADERYVLDTVVEHGSLLTREMKKLCGYGGKHPQRKNFDGTVTKLQMSCHLLTAMFEYNYTRDGRRYGWSVARLCTPEDFFGEERLLTDHTPNESFTRLTNHLKTILPAATDRQIARIMG